MKSYSLRLVPLVAAVLLTSACSSLNPFASSAAKPAALVDFTPSAELASTWSANIGDAGPYRFQPAVWSDAVYAAGHDGEVARFEAGARCGAPIPIPTFRLAWAPTAAWRWSPPPTAR
jgi:hypothetical protein